MRLNLILTFASVIITNTAQAQPTASLNNVSLIITTEPLSTLSSQTPEIMKTSYSMMTPSSDYGNKFPVINSSELRSPNTTESKLPPIFSSSSSRHQQHSVTYTTRSPTSEGTTTPMVTTDAVVQTKLQSTSLFALTTTAYKTQILVKPTSSSAKLNEQYKTQILVKPTSSSAKLNEQIFQVTLKITSEKFKEAYSTSIRASKEKEKQIEKQFDRIFKTTPEYVYAEVVRFFGDDYLECEILVHTESADTKPLSIEKIRNILNSTKTSEKGFETFVVADIDVQKRDSHEGSTDQDEDKGETWGVSIIIISILCAICLLLLLVLISLCILKRHYFFPQSPKNQEESNAIKLKTNDDFDIGYV